MGTKKRKKKKFNPYKKTEVAPVKPRAKMSRRKKITVAIVFILSVVSAIAYMWVSSFGDAFNPSDKTEITVEIPSGAGSVLIGQILEDNNIIESATKFKYYTKLKDLDDEFKAGTYKLSPSMSAEEICEIISSGHEISSSVYIPEGYSIDKIGEKLEKDGRFTKAEFENALLTGDFSKYDFLNNGLTGLAKFEGYLFADTYSLPDSASVNDLIAMMLENSQSKFDSIAKEVKKSRRSLHEILTVASIVEREAKKQDMTKVASVIYNRLDVNMKLQMCSTLAYITGLDPVQASFADINTQSPYNTYLHEGLPPGPISTMSMDAIKAALNPDKTKYMYFVVSEKFDGTNVFSVDYDDFLKNKAKFEKAYREKYN